ncbi:MAG: hypothetical protein M1823_003961 [Watsoniomyces obsoletus]|nr:MAG: hypothetical protein M1823_003961 [Watsoniomyces obsoletus]
MERPLPSEGVDLDSADSNRPSTTVSQSTPRHPRDWFTIPKPLRHLFDAFPLITYAPNPPPLRSLSRPRNLPCLYIFSHEQDARYGRPSFNPACLKWQTYLRFHRVEFKTIASNNHASPSGALPFLLPPPVDPTGDHHHDRINPIPSNQIEKWLREQPGLGVQPEPSDLRYDAFLALLDNRIRKAWLCTLYLDPRHQHIMQNLYIRPCTSTSIVRYTLSYQLQRSAQAELLKGTSPTRIPNVSEIYRDAEEAFSALSTLLGDDEEWFFASNTPGLFDASVFAYTHLLLDLDHIWTDQTLIRILKGKENLVRHRERISERYY